MDARQQNYAILDTAILVVAILDFPNKITYGNLIESMLSIEEEEEECCLFDHHHGSGGYIKTQYKSLTCRPPKYIQFSYVAKKINIVN